MGIKTNTAKPGNTAAKATTLLAAAILIAVLSLGSPTPTQGASGRELIWSSTMTVGSTGNAKGYAKPSVGALPNPSFTSAMTPAATAALMMWWRQ